jgi:rhamnosyltransferase
MLNHASVIVTYFPDETALENLARLCDLCDSVIVIDNTPRPKRESFPSRANLSILNCSENPGLAAGLNAGMKRAQEEGIEHVFLFDQDSRPSDRYFQDMLSFKSNLSRTTARVAFCAPNFYDRNSRTFATFPLIGRYSLRHVSCKNMPPTTDDAALIAITSGMLITASAYRVIGPFREDYFIDFVDNEYCLRASILGYSIAVNCHLLLDHAVGCRSVKRLFGLTIKPNHHNPVRRYYIFRNGIRTAIDYFRFYPSYTILMAVRLTHELISVLLYETAKRSKLTMMIRGFWHGITGRMGKC